MERTLVDVLEPIKGETFFSWLLRMIKHYSTKDNAQHFSKISKEIFGCSRMPDLFWPDNVEEIVNKCNLIESAYLSNFSTVIEQMTNINLYTDICYGDKVRFNSCAEYKAFYKKHKYSPHNWYDYYIHGLTLCPECLKENKEPVFYREHQIKGNMVCWKHGCLLQHAKYERQWNSLNSIYDLSFTETIKPVSLDEEEFKIAKQLADEIHNVFLNGLKESLDTIIKKMTQKLFYDNEIIWKKQYSLKDCNNCFLSELKESYFSKLKLRCNFDELYVALFNKRKYEFNDPMFLIACVCGIFGSFDDMYSYELKESVPYLNCNRYTHTLNYYEDTLPDVFFKNYDILGEYQGVPIVKHKLCGHIAVDMYDDLQKYRCSFCDQKMELAKKVEKVFQKREYIEETQFRREKALNLSCTNYLIDNNLVECIELNYFLRLLPADFVLTKDMRRLFNEKWGLYYDEFGTPPFLQNDIKENP